MKKLLFLLIAVFSFSTANAQSLFNAVSEGAFAAYNNATSTLSPREREITQKLRTVSSLKPRTITWEEFMQEATQVAQDQARFDENENALLERFYKLRGAKKAARENISAHQGHPDYAKETKGIKYIYTSDASSHATQSIPAEVARLLREIRQANPEARILLASEFAVRTNSFKTPICFASQEECSLSTANPAYNLLHVHALYQLNIDLLGLDDHLQDDIWPKVGDTRVTYSSDDPQIQNILEKAGDFSFIHDSLLNYLSSSFWGALQRNRQWTRYIRAISPFYDIIVVYCGGGHLFGAQPTLPNLLAEPSVEFHFLSSEEVAEEETSQISIYQAQVNAGTRNNEEHLMENLMGTNFYQDIIKVLDNIVTKNHIDPDKDFYVKSTDVSDPVLFGKWQQMYQQQFGQPYVPGMQFEVYLFPKSLEPTSVEN